MRRLPRRNYIVSFSASKIMPRVKRGILKTKKRRKILRLAKGYTWGRKSKKKLAKDALLHAGVHAYQGRKQKKRDNRRLWQVRVNAAVRKHGLKYGEFVHLLRKRNIELNRKVLSEIAAEHPLVFGKIVAVAKRQ